MPDAAVLGVMMDAGVAAMTSRVVRVAVAMHDDIGVTLLSV